MEHALAMMAAILASLHRDFPSRKNLRLEELRALVPMKFLPEGESQKCFGDGIRYLQDIGALFVYELVRDERDVKCATGAILSPAAVLALDAHIVDPSAQHTTIAARISEIVTADREHPLKAHEITALAAYLRRILAAFATRGA